MNALLKRLAEIEALLAVVELASPADDDMALTDAECVDLWRRMCHRPTPRPEPVPLTEEAAVIAAWRGMQRR
jgi:hypothetical protein